MFRLNFENKDKNIKIQIIAVCMTIIVVSTAFVINFFRVRDEINKGKFNSNSLIQEVGAMEKEMLIKTFESKVSDLKIKKLEKQLNLINKKLSILESTEKDLEQTKLELEKAQIDLQIMQKNNYIKDKKIENLVAKAIGNEQTADKGFYADNHLDFLILGKRDGLTDSIITATINEKTKKIILVSYPRDLYFNGRKINEIYNKYGIEKIAEAVYLISGVLPEKYMVLDLNSFVEVIDSVGGIDLNVPKKIYDKSYPGQNSSYQVFEIEAGQQHLDGATALKYARSRKSSSDFERSKRQQQIIESFYTKLKSMSISENLPEYYKLFTNLMTSINTNIEMLSTFSYYQDFKNFTFVRENVLSTSNFLHSTKNIQGQYILLPISGNYQDIKTHVETLINQ